jgi:hypothetical protein
MLCLARSCGRPPLTCLFEISGCIHVSQNQPALGLHLASYCPQAELRVSAGRPDNRNLGDERLEQPRRMNDQRSAPEIEKSFVAAHARARAPRKKEASDLVIAIHHCQSILRPRSGLAQRSGEL